VKTFGLGLILSLASAGLVSAQANPPDAPQPQSTSHRSYFSFSPPLSLAKDTRPMTVGDKFKLFALNTANPFQIFASSAWAGIDQADDRFPSWGQGAEGYGKRVGANYADTASAEFFGTFLFPAIMRTDPRYFRKEAGGFGSRLGYAISRIAITRTDHGGSAPNVALWMGALAAGGLSNAYYPNDQNTAGQTLGRAGIAIATSAGFNIAREFWPDVSRHLFHHKK